MKSLTNLSDEFDVALAERKTDESQIAILKESLAFHALIDRIHKDCSRHHLEYDNEKLCRNAEYRDGLIEQIVKFDAEQTKNDAVYDQMRDNL